MNPTIKQQNSYPKTRSSLTTEYQERFHLPSSYIPLVAISNLKGSYHPLKGTSADTSRQEYVKYVKCPPMAPQPPLPPIDHNGLLSKPAVPLRPKDYIGSLVTNRPSKESGLQKQSVDVEANSKVGPHLIKPQPFDSDTKEPGPQRAQPLCSMTTYQERFKPPCRYTPLVAISKPKGPYHQLKGTSGDTTTFRQEYVKCVKHSPVTPKPPLPPIDHSRPLSKPAVSVKPKDNPGSLVKDRLSKESGLQKQSVDVEANSKLAPHMLKPQPFDSDTKQLGPRRAQPLSSMTTEHQERFQPPCTYVPLVAISNTKSPYHPLKGTSGDMTIFRQEYVKCVKHSPVTPKPPLPPIDHSGPLSKPAVSVRPKENPGSLVQDRPSKESGLQKQSVDVEPNYSDTKQPGPQRVQPLSSMTTYQERFQPPCRYTPLVAISKPKGPYHPLKGTNGDTTTFRQEYVKCMKEPPLPPIGHKGLLSKPAISPRPQDNLRSLVKDRPSKDSGLPQKMAESKQIPGHSQRCNNHNLLNASPANPNPSLPFIYSKEAPLAPCPPPGRPARPQKLLMETGQTVPRYATAQTRAVKRHQDSNKLLPRRP